MKILVSPLDEAAGLIGRHRPQAVVSLLSPDAEPPAWETAAPRLVLSFNDISGPRDGLVAPGRCHIERLIAFIEPRPDPLLIHCWAGVSRSTAAAYVAACWRDGPGSEEALADRLRRAAPYATPNPLIVSLGDAVLGRSGAMSKAVARIGRGADTNRGASFWF